MKFNRILPLAAVVALSAVGVAHADVTGVTTAITAAGTDGQTILTNMASMGAGLFIIWRVLKKFGIV